uniref:Thioredoxin-related transmembrane protein 1 n=1 Tax=Lygus hesperus TaxID=30085 RepID=A0A0A9W0N3_LYGHE
MAGSKFITFALVASFVLVINFGSTFSKSQLIRLDEENWSNMLTGEWMVEFYAPWCPACKALQPLWEEFSTWSKDLGVSVAQIDITSSPGLSGRFMVTALPTIFHVVNGEFRQYKGSRDRESFMSFVEERKWEQIETVPSWKHPSSVQMSVVSYFFKLSQGLRTIHNKLMVEYGLPTWGSYVIFSLVTIILGALLGLIMVCCIDYVYPPKVPAPTPGETEADALAGGDNIHDSDEDLPDEEVDGEASADEIVSESTSTRKRKARKAD